MPQPDYRIHEMNKRLQQRTDDSDNLWWDAFATEFFEDDANLTLTFCLEDGPKRYSNTYKNFSHIYYFENNKILIPIHILQHLILNKFFLQVLDVH